MHVFHINLNKIFIFCKIFKLEKEGMVVKYDWNCSFQNTIDSRTVYDSILIKARNSLCSTLLDYSNHVMYCHVLAIETYVCVQTHSICALIIN